MTEIFDFPVLPGAKQLFHVPGAAMEGGYTAGAVRILSPEPGGRSVLELQTSFSVNEWENPVASWLMSKGNGEVFRIRLTRTPQVITQRSIPRASFDAYPRDEEQWHAPNPATDLTTLYTATALEGENTVKIDMSSLGPILKPGHVFGHGNTTYKVDKITYDANLIATIVCKPPLRKNIAIGNMCLFTPYFLGTIGNIAEVRTTYDAELGGSIQLGKIIFAEAIV